MDEKTDYEQSLEREVIRLQAALRAEAAHWRARAAAVEQAIEDYMLWQPGRRGHAAAHKRLASVLREEQER